MQEFARYRTFHSDKDSLYATCALCSVKGRINIQMFTATYKCPDSWVLEYKGYLMTDHSATTFVCIDIELDGYKISGDTEADTTHPTLDHVQAYLQIIHGDVYREHNVLSCAICSR